MESVIFVSYWAIIFMGLAGIALLVFCFRFVRNRMQNKKKIENLCGDIVIGVGSLAFGIILLFLAAISMPDTNNDFYKAKQTLEGARHDYTHNLSCSENFSLAVPSLSYLDIEWEGWQGLKVCQANCLEFDSPGKNKLVKTSRSTTTTISILGSCDEGEKMLVHLRY
jgi:hypothetical protein